MKQLPLPVLMLLLVRSMKALVERIPDLSIGVPAGYLPYCPGVEKNSTLSKETLQLLQVTIHWNTEGREYHKNFPIETVLHNILSDRHIDLKSRKTILYCVPYYEGAFAVSTHDLGNLYYKMGYNVLILDTFATLTRHYPKAVRLSKAVGLEAGKLLVKLMEHGLDPDNLELIGMSIGAQVISYAAKHMKAVTGKRPHKITGLDPSGPCYRNQPHEDVFFINDAERVVAYHTNIDGLGTARRLGHVDFYLNGGEFQPGDPGTFVCLDLCSHSKSLEFYLAMLRYPKLFIGVQCDSVQDARFAKCFGNPVQNYGGVFTDFSKPGIYYLPTNLEYPYYGGEEGLAAVNEPFEKYMRDDNSEDVFEA
ncbi:unnamed protein product [Leptosia nina]|uniref:Lipase domain-containing protein n=1 Tax=Leptosia nina TaxID=320188 RepID=A0AAV1JXD2_9NEOP